MARNYRFLERANQRAGRNSSLGDSASIHLSCCAYAVARYTYVLLESIEVREMAFIYFHKCHVWKTPGLLLYKLISLFINLFIYLFKWMLFSRSFCFLIEEAIFS